VKAVDKANSHQAQDARMYMASARTASALGQCEKARAFRIRARTLWRWHRYIAREPVRPVMDIEPFPGSCELGACERAELNWQSR